MREIKFRAWNKYGMTLPFSIKQISEKPAVKGQKILEVKWDDGTVFMQFTGLLDKNGKEIYEGDVLKFKNGSIGVVAYGEIKAVVDDEVCLLNLYCVQYKKWNCIIEKSDEVIGNIYENPNLLTSSELTIKETVK